MRLENSDNFKKLGEGCQADIKKIYTIFPLKSLFLVPGTTRKLSHEIVTESIKLEGQFCKQWNILLEEENQTKSNNQTTETTKPTPPSYESRKQHWEGKKDGQKTAFPNEAMGISIDTIPPKGSLASCTRRFHFLTEITKMVFFQ